MNTNGRGYVCTLTVGASGTGSVDLARSNVPFKNLTVVIKPLSDARYTGTIFFYGEVEEEHTYNATGDNPVTFHTFPHVLFPPNLGTATIPQFFDPSRHDFRGIPIVAQVENLEATTQEFEVYVIFEEFPQGTMRRIVQES